VVGLGIDQEFQPIVFLFQVFQEDLFRFPIGPFHIIDQKLLEVAGNYPFGMFRARHVGHVLLSLLEGSKHDTAALFDGSTQVFIDGFLFYENLRRRDVTVNEVGRVYHGSHLFFLADEVWQILYAKNVSQEICPKQL
jgi:hypothetical protein